MNPLPRGKNTVKRNSERRIPRKSSENRRLFTRANLVVRPAFRVDLNPRFWMISGPRPDVRTRDLCVVSLSPSHLSYRGSRLTSQHLKCLCVNTCLIFNPWWIFSPCNMIMCTNKTCFAGVGTWPKPIFRIRISFLSNPCKSKKIQNFLSADQTSIPGVNQVFPVLEWNLIFVLQSKILDRLKRLFAVQILRVAVYREMRNIYVSQLFVGAVTKSKWGELVWELKNRCRKKL